MIDELKQYRAFGKFVEWMLPTYRMRNREFIEPPPPSRVVSERELLSLLVEFCDNEGCFIAFTSFDDDNIICHSVEIIVHKRYKRHSIGEIFNSRTEATKAAIVKCFELMEKEI